MGSRSSEVTGKAPAPLPCKDTAAEHDWPANEMVFLLSSLGATALFRDGSGRSLFSISKFKSWFWFAG
jgi:hypothetical protein